MTCDGTGVVSHAGTVLLAELADRIGLTAALGTNEALAMVLRPRQRRQQHRRRSPHRAGPGPESDPGPVAQQEDPDPRRRRGLLPRPDHPTFPAGPGVLVGYPVTEAVRDAIRLVPKEAWQAANNSDGGLREHADVIEVTGLLDLSRWTKTCPGMGVTVREPPHPGAALDAFWIRDGYRYQAFTTNTPRGQLTFLELLLLASQVSDALADRAKRVASGSSWVSRSS